MTKSTFLSPTLLLLVLCLIFICYPPDSFVCGFSTRALLPGNIRTLPLSTATATEKVEQPPLKAITALTTSALISLTPIIARAVDVVDDSNLDDIEIAELPPVWVPIVFAIAILGGVGLLTSSLGDVYNEGKFILTLILLFKGISIVFVLLIPRISFIHNHLHISYRGIIGSHVWC